jgi:hypothetical protein
MVPAIIARLVITWLVKARFVETSFFEISCAVAGGTRIAAGMFRRRSIALLPWLGLAARKFLVAAKFSVALRTVSVRPIALRSAVVLAETFAAWRIRPLIAELLLGEP